MKFKKNAFNVIFHKMWHLIKFTLFLYFNIQLILIGPLFHHEKWYCSTNWLLRPIVEKMQSHLA